MPSRFLVFLILCCSITGVSLAGDSLFFKLHFVYGSRPKHGFKSVEKTYFGGIHGGHVYMEIDHEIFSFGPNKGQWHIFGHKRRVVGCYRLDSNLVWCGDTGKLKITTITIPVTKAQMQQFKSLEQQYLKASPYDYAFFGMRCAAAAYDILSHTGICKKRSRVGMITNNFYPKRLRVKLLKRAQKEHWTVERQQGRATRKWERD
jgi:hypothetical protein